MTLELTEAKSLSDKENSENLETISELEKENDALTSLNLVNTEKLKCLESELEEVATAKGQMEGQILTQENEFLLLKSSLELQLGEMTRSLEMLSEKCTFLETELENANAKTRRGSEDLLDLQGKLTHWCQLVLSGTNTPMFGFFDYNLFDFICRKFVHAPQTVPLRG